MSGRLFAGPAPAAVSLSGTDWRRADALAILSLFAATALLYWRTLGFDFVTWDDYSYVVGNPHMVGGLNTRNTLWALTGFHSGNWHPLTWWSHMLDVSLWGVTRPGAHHAVNVVLHAINAALLYGLLRRTGMPLVVALLSALLFAVHPLRVESVAWVSERKDLLAALFWLGGLHAYLGYAARPGWRGYLATTLCVAAALASKPVAVTFPLICVALDVWLLRRAEGPGWRALWPLLREKLPWLAMALATGIAVIAAQHSGGAIVDTRSLPLFERLIVVASSYAWYLARFLWPENLSFFYRVELAQSPIAAVASAVVVAGISWLCWRLRRACPLLAFGWVWYLVVLLPMSGIVKVGGQAWADRYAYLPLIGIVWGLAAAVSSPLAAPEMLRWRRAAVLGCSAFTLVMAALAWFQVGVWRDTGTLTKQAISADSRNALAFALAGDWAARQGQMADAERYSAQALGLSEQGYVRDIAYLALGIVAYRRADYLTARAFLIRHLELKPDSAAGLMNLASAEVHLGNLDAAQRHLERVLAISPGQSEAWNIFGIVLIRRQQPAAALAAFNRALLLDPANPRARGNLAALLNQHPELAAGRAPGGSLPSPSPALPK